MVADKSPHSLTYAVVGNVQGIVIGDRVKRMVMTAGIVGAGYKNLAREVRRVLDEK